MKPLSPFQSHRIPGALPLTPASGGTAAPGKTSVEARRARSLWSRFGSPGIFAGPLGIVAIGLLGAAPLAADFEELTGGGERPNAAATEYLAEGSGNSAADPLKQAENEIETGAREVMEKAADNLVEKVFGADAEAQPEESGFAQFEASGAVIHYSLDLKDAVARIQEPVQRGLTLIQSELESPGLPRSPHFWLVADDEQLAALLKKNFPDMQASLLKAAVAARAYVKDDTFFLVYKTGIARQRLIRLLYNEFALLHLNVLAAGGPEKRVAWFHSGMAAYLAWITEAELTGAGSKDVEKKMIQYYGRNFDSKKARPLKQLEQPAAWATAIRADYKGVYAQAALTWMYFVRRSSLSAGPLILRSMATGESFDDAFLNATDLRLGRFERDVRDSFYPELQAARKVVEEAKAKAAADARAKADAKAKADAATKTEADAEAKAKDEAKPETGAEPKAETKAQPAAKSQGGQ